MRTGVVLTKAAWLVLAAVLFLSVGSNSAQTTANDQSVELTATVSETSPGITLQWQADSNATGYRISRKILGETEWKLMIVMDPVRSGWIDLKVNPGEAYEYQVIKTTNAGYTGYGYICA